MSTSTVTPMVRSAVEADLVDVKVRKRQVTAIVATDRMDRECVVIHPGGADVQAYFKNPIVMWMNGQDKTRGTVPVGKCLSIITARHEGMRTLQAVVQFRDDKFSAELFENYASGDLRAWGLGILPKDNGSSLPTHEEIRAFPELAKCRGVHRDYEVGFISALAVGDDPNALTVSVERSLTTPEQASIMTAVLTAQRVEFMQDLVRDIRRLAEANQRPRGPRVMGL